MGKGRDDFEKATQNGFSSGAAVCTSAPGAAAIGDRDHDLLVTGRDNGIDIVSPRKFLSRLSS